MRSILSILLLVMMLAAPLARAEDDVELALDPPEAELDRAPDEDDGLSGDDALSATDAIDAETPTNDVRVPAVDDDSFEGQQFSERSKILRFHRRLQTDSKIAERATQENGPHTFHLGLGAHVVQGSYLGAAVDFQTALANHFAVGLVGQIFSYPERKELFGTTLFGRVNVAGGGVTLNYYSRRPYEGIWIQGGIGYDQFRNGDKYFKGDVVATTAPIFWNIGWRFLEDDKNMTFAFSLGGRGYFFDTNPRFFFAARLEMGFAFNVFPH